VAQKTHRSGTEDTRSAAEGIRCYTGDTRCGTENTSQWQRGHIAVAQKTQRQWHRRNITVPQKALL